MIHVCRDFLSIGNPITLDSTKLVQYYLAIFLRTCLGYVVFGQTNFDLTGSTLNIANGTTGAINQGSTNEYAFSINSEPPNPRTGIIPASYVVSAADIGRILAVRSVANGMVNSGLFRVTGIDIDNNWFFVDYRSGDVPPVETGMTWALYASETVFHALINLTGNGETGTYTGQGAATQSRIILQSPSVLGWQVRIAFENLYDVQSAGDGAVTPSDNSYGATVAPGMGGDGAGDFVPGGQHLHGVLFFNAHDNDLSGTTCGWWPSSAKQVRVYIWGDDSTYSVAAAARNVLSGADSWLHFGVAENEEQPLPPKNVQRLFVMGGNASAGSGINSITWSSGAGTGGGAGGRGGVGFGLSNQPISCVYSLYNRLSGAGFGGTAAWKQTAAGDNPYLSATELLPVELLVGTLLNQTSNVSTNTQIQPLEGRRLGQAPLVMMGRSNYGYFQIAQSSGALWLHLNDGIYLPWQGSILP